MKELKIIIADDSEALRILLHRTLSVIENFRVVGIATDGVEAIRVARELEPHVLVLDISMPLKDGIDVLYEIRAELSSTVIVMFTADPSLLNRTICMEAGADYFLDKSQIIDLIKICHMKLLAI